MVESGIFGGKVVHLALVALALTAMLLFPSAASAASAPGWDLHAMAIPSRFSAPDNENPTCSAKEGFVGCDAYEITATDVGSKATSPDVLTFSDVVPPSLTVQRVELHFPALGRFLSEGEFFPVFLAEQGFPSINESSDLFPVMEHVLGACSSGSTVQCSVPPFPGLVVAPDEAVRMMVYVTSPSGEETLHDTAQVEGGAPTVSASVDNKLGGATPPFGITAFSAHLTGMNGQPETQAAGHPYEFTTRIDFNSALINGPDATFASTSVQDPKDVVVDLPLGMAGSAKATPQCTFAQLSSRFENGPKGGFGGCPTDTVVGHIRTDPTNERKLTSINGPVYNMVPERGEPAEFAFVDLLRGSHVIYTNIVPTPAGYVLQATVHDVPQVPLTDTVVSIYGNPSVRNGSGTQPLAMLTAPSDCSGDELITTVHVDSWQNPGRVNPDGTPDFTDPRWASASSSSPPVTECNRLRFAPAVSLQPDTTVADSPAGLNVDIKVPQSEEFASLATPPLRKAEVAFPVGMTVNPGAAQGLGACSKAQIDLASSAAPQCPESSKIGTVEVTSPLIGGVLHGSVYLASQGDNPFNALFAFYVVIDDAETGIVAKIPGRLSLNGDNGQITAVVENAPQLPFTDLHIRFKGGARGVLATPETCGNYATTLLLSPWSAPDSGPDSNLSDSFGFESGCVAGFAPSFTAGTTVPQAGAYGALVESFSRADTDEEISGVTMTLPPGLLAKIAGLGRCTDEQLAAAAASPSGVAQAVSPSCPSSSQIGTVTAGSGPGPNPIFVSGKAYLTGPYEGAPFGVAVIIPAVAGPFDLGNVVVRAALHIDPADGHATVTTDPLPVLLNSTGVPTRLRRVDISIDRPGFVLNPTSCEPMSVGATFRSTSGVASAATSRFQVGGCQSLPFKPSFSASTNAHTSRLNGASFTVKVSQKPGEANIRKVEIQLPAQLPSRLTTLNKACTEAQFNANPASCPAESRVGTATAVTPLLNIPLTGPVYLVSRGSAAFPDLEMILQGEGVQIILDGKTDIKHGITYSRFETVPDAPISSFQAIFPQGPHSVLGAITSFCSTTTKSKRVTVHSHGKTRRVTRTIKRTSPATLLMPTSITGQNGAKHTQTTIISVAGCSTKRRVSTRAKARGKSH
jgi:hypothetical protein